MGAPWQPPAPSIYSEQLPEIREDSLDDYYLSLWMNHSLKHGFISQLWFQSHVSIHWDHFQRWDGRLQLSVHDQRVWNPSFTKQFHSTRCGCTELSQAPVQVFTFGLVSVLMDGSASLNEAPRFQRMLLCRFSSEDDAEVMISPAFHLFLHLSLSGPLIASALKQHQTASPSSGLKEALPSQSLLFCGLL